MVADMLQVVGDPRRIDRAIARLRGALKGVPARGVRLTWRGGELRTTIHWARDDAFWWAVERRDADRDTALLGHAPEAPTQAREHHLQPQSRARRSQPKDGRHRRCGRARARSISPIPAGWAARAPASAPRPSAISSPTACGGRCEWPDGRRSRGADRGAARQPAPDAPARPVRRFSAPLQGGRRAGQRRAALCLQPSRRDSADVRLRPAAGRRGAARGARQARPVRRRPRSLLAARRAAAPAVRRWWPAAGPTSWRAPSSRCRAPRRGGATPCGRSWSPRNSQIARPRLDSARPSPACAITWRGARAVFDGLDDALA